MNSSNCRGRRGHNVRELPRGLSLEGPGVAAPADACRRAAVRVDEGRPQARGEGDGGLLMGRGNGGRGVRPDPHVHVPRVRPPPSPPGSRWPQGESALRYDGTGFHKVCRRLSIKRLLSGWLLLFLGKRFWSSTLLHSPFSGGRHPKNIQRKSFEIIPPKSSMMQKWTTISLWAPPKVFGPLHYPLVHGVLSFEKENKPPPPLRAGN
jgi:hypothetical protein